MMLLWILALLTATATSYPTSKVNPADAAQMATAQYLVYSHPGIQGGVAQAFARQGAGQVFDNQHAGQYMQGRQDAEIYPASGYAFYLDDLSHNENDRLAGAVAEAGASVAGHGVEVAEPIFSDMSALDPVYAFKARSSYSQGRATFFRSHYEPAKHPVMPIYQSVYTVNVPAGGNVQTVIQANDQVKGSN